MSPEVCDADLIGVLIWAFGHWVENSKKMKIWGSYLASLILGQILCDPLNLFDIFIQALEFSLIPIEHLNF